MEYKGIKFNTYNEFINQLKEKYPDKPHMLTWDTLFDYVRDNNLVDKAIEEEAEDARRTGEDPTNKPWDCIIGKDEVIDAYIYLSMHYENYFGNMLTRWVDKLKDKQVLTDDDFEDFFIWELSPLTIEWEEFDESFDEGYFATYIDEILDDARDLVEAESEYTELLRCRRFNDKQIIHTFCEDKKTKQIADINNGHVYDLSHIIIARNTGKYIKVYEDDISTDTKLLDRFGTVTTTFKNGLRVLMIDYKSRLNVYNINEPCDVIFYENSKAVIKILDKEDSNE